MSGELMIQSVKRGEPVPAAAAKGYGPFVRHQTLPKIASQSVNARLETMQLVTSRHGRKVS